VAPEVREYQAGLVVSAAMDPLHEALAQLAGDPGLCHQLGTNARRLADERFSLDVTTGRLIALYEQVLRDSTECGAMNHRV
jgi:glycosyltransferase involved in cell wall biosynthesis